MFLTWDKPMTEIEVRQLGWQACDRFGGMFWTDWEKGRAALNRYVPPRWSDFKPKAETVLKINTTNRYYGPGYERGPVLDFINLAGWLDERLPGCQVWYGPDHDDAPRPFTNEERRALWDHFVEHGHHPYRDIPRFGMYPPDCTFCYSPMTVHLGYSGHSGGRARCIGCGLEVEKKGSDDAPWMPYAAGRGRDGGEGASAVVSQPLTPPSRQALVALTNVERLYQRTASRNPDPRVVSLLERAADEARELLASEGSQTGHGSASS